MTRFEYLAIGVSLVLGLGVTAAEGHSDRALQPHVVRGIAGGDGIAQVRGQAGGETPGDGAMKEDDRLVLHVQRVLPISRAVVYRALTEPEELAKWWGPRGFSAPSIDFHPLVGGSYRIAMQPPEGELFHLSGEFREVDPPARLAYTFRWSPPDPDDRETLVALSLEDRDAGTELLLIHDGFATESRRALHEAGWSESLDRLQQILTDTAS